jgi:regulatory protein spx
MVILYTTPGSSGSRKAKAWFRQNHIPFMEKNMFTTVLNPSEIRALLMRTENGAEDLISSRSKIIQEQKIDINSMTVAQLIGFIQKNPSVLRRPIMLDEKHFLIGYDPEEISVFLPRERRNGMPVLHNLHVPQNTGKTSENTYA